MYTRITLGSEPTILEAIRRDSDGAFIPKDARNADWRAYESWVNAGNVPAEDTSITNKPFVPDITDRQFGRGLWGDGIITFEECEAFVSTGAIPAKLQTLVDDLPDDDTGNPTPQKEAIILIKGAKTYQFANPFVATLGEAFGWDAAERTAKWREWAAL